jgi:DNA repair exonuclease SbcCD ATPase subunit
MAEAQHAAHLWQYIAAHPILAILAGFTSGSAFHATLTHPASPIGFGRRLTAAEAHGPLPVDTAVDVDPLPLPAAEPDISPFTKIDLPHMTTYGALQPVAIHAQTTLDSGHLLAPVTPGSGQEICMLSGVLVALVGIGAAFTSAEYLRRKSARRALSDDDAIAWLQSQINNAKTDIQTLGNQLQTAQGINQTLSAQLQSVQTNSQTLANQLQSVQASLVTSQASERSCQNSVRALQTRLDLVRTVELAETNQQLENTLREKEYINELLRQLTEGHQAALQDHQTSLKRDQDAHVAALTASKAETSEANDRRMSQLASEKAALKRERDNNIAALTASKAELSKVNALRMLQEETATTEMAHLKQERLNYIVTSTASKDAALEASQLRVTNLMAEKATLEQEKLASMRREQGLIVHQTALEAKVESWVAKCSAYEQELKEHEEESSAYRKNCKDIMADMMRMIVEKDTDISSLETQLHNSNIAIATAGVELDSERLRLQSEIGSMQQEEERRTTELENQFDTINSDMNDLNETLQSLRDEKEQLTTDLTSSRQACAQKDDDLSSLQSENGRLSSELHRSQRECIKQDEVLDSSRESEKKKHDELGEAQHYVTQLESEVVQLRASENNLEVELQELRQMHAAHIDKIEVDQEDVTAAAVKAAIEIEQKNAQAARENMASEHTAAMEDVKQKANLDEKELARKHELALEQNVTRFTAEKTDAVNKAQSTITSLEKELEETRHTISSLEKKLDEDRGTISSLENKLEEANTRAMSLEKAREDLQAHLDDLKDQKIVAEDSLKGQLEQHQGAEQLEVATKDHEIADITKKLNDLSAEIVEQGQCTQQLEVQLEQKTKELSSHLESHTAEVQHIGNINEQQLIQIQSLNDSAEKDKAELESLARENEKLQIQADGDAAAVQAGIERLEQTVDKTDAMLTTLRDELHASTQEKEQAVMELEEQRISNEQETATNLRTDRVKVPNGLTWSNPTTKDDYQDVVRHGIIQQGKYRLEELVPLLLSYTDPFYSELPHPIPQPYNFSNGGETHSCGHCHETYGRRDYYNHGKMCGFFFADYAVFCTHCESLFLSNSASQKHEEVCGKARKSGIAPEVLAKQPPIDEFDVLEKNATQTPSTSSSFQDIAQKKSATLGSVPGDTLVRAVLPFADRDYASCNLPEPVELDAVLPQGFVGDTFGQKFWCDNCKLWYKKSAKPAHLVACNSFFKGRYGHHPHACCQFCGDIFRDNAGFLKHMELCKMSPSKDLCLFCRDLFNVEGNELAEHTPGCYANPDRAHYVLPARPDRRKRVCETGLEAPDSDGNLMIGTSSTPTGPAVERAASGDAQTERAPQDDGQLRPQALASANEPTENTPVVASLPKTDRTSPKLIDAPGDKELSIAHTATTTTAAFTTTPTASQTPSPSAKISPGAFEFSQVHIGVNRSPQPPIPSTPSLSTASTPGNLSITSSSVLATPFVPKTASPTPNFPDPQGGLGMSRFSPGFVGSHPGPPMNAYNNYSPSPPPSNFQPRGFGYRGSHPPQFNSGVSTLTMNSPFLPHDQNNTGFPSNLKGPAGFSPHMQHNTGFQRNIRNPNNFPPQLQGNSSSPQNMQGDTGLPPPQPNDYGSAPSTSTGRFSRPINTTLGSANTRTFVCKHCDLRLPRAMLSKHMPECRKWRHSARDTPPPNSDDAIKSPSSDESTKPPSSDDAIKP